MSYTIFLKKRFPTLSYWALGKIKPYLKDRMNILKRLRINVVFDVGANIGQYAHMIRKLGYDGKILSFEPLEGAFKKLKKWSEDDENWEAYNFAVGGKEGDVEINVSENSVSSSLLPISGKLSSIAPKACYVTKQKTKCKTLGVLIDEHCPGQDNIFVKLDTQGYEKIILEGSEGSLDRIAAMQLELSFNELYIGESGLLEMLNWLDARNFRLVSIEPGWCDTHTGFMMETDAIFVRKDLLEQ